VFPEEDFGFERTVLTTFRRYSVLFRELFYGPYNSAAFDKERYKIWGNYGR
jgi:hypothetical protein